MTAHLDGEELDIARQLEELEQFSFPKIADPEDDLTGKACYVSACKRLDGGSGVILSLPVNAVVDKLEKEVMCLDHFALGDRGVQAVCEALHINRTVTSLSLVGNYITPLGAAYAASMLMVNKSIRILDLSENALGRVSSVNVDGGVGPILRQLLSKNTTLVQLSLRGNSISDFDAEQIAEGCIENHTLQRLDLSYNSIKLKGADAIARMIHNNYELLEVNLAWNQFRAKGCLSVLGEGLAQNNIIKRFNISWNGLDDDGAVQLAKVIAENAIEEIDVSHNRIGAAGSQAIAGALRATSALSTLVLDDNPLKDAGCCAIIAALRETSTVTYVSLLQTGCGKAALSECTDTLRARSNLTIVVPERIALS